MYIGHTPLCVSVCLSLSLDPDVSGGNGRWCPLVVHYSEDLQSVHGFCCHDNIAPNAKCQQVLVLTLCLINFYHVSIIDFTHMRLAAKYTLLECGPMPNVMVALPNIGGALCSTPQFG